MGTFFILSLYNEKINGAGDIINQRRVQPRFIITRVSIYSAEVIQLFRVFTSRYEVFVAMINAS